MMLRRASSVVCYWEDDRLLFENYASGIRISAEPLAAEILHFFHRWRSVDALVAHLDEFSPSSVRAAVASLERHTFLHRSGSIKDRRAAAMEEWSPWNPAAGFFHVATKDVPFSDIDTADRILRKKARRTPIPRTVKRYAAAAELRLPAAALAGQFPQILLARRTHRAFARRRLKLEDLATLLGLTWGVQDWLDLGFMGRMPLKTSPSGGARQPIEVYVLARRVEGCEPGLYHYAPDRHRLELVRRGATRPQIGRYLPAQPWFQSAAAVMLMTAVFARTKWKYETPRAYRVILAEVGHLCKTFCLTATWLGLAPFCTMALADSKIESDLGIDGISESVLYAAGVGVRPAGDRPPL